MSGNRPEETTGAALPKSFGKRREPATVTIVRNGRAHHFSFNPLTLSVAFSVVAMFMVGYLTATAYLIFRDDLIGAARARNVRLMHEYEDRIATLRSNLDRVTSRQLLDQQVIEAKIAELLKREEQLRDRSGRIGELVDAARRNGLVKSGDEASATPSPDDAAPLTTGSVTTGSIFSRAPVVVAEAGLALRGTHDGGRAEPPALAIEARGTGTEVAGVDIGDIAATDTLFDIVAGRIDAIDAGQVAMLDDIRMAAGERFARIAGIMGRLDVDVPLPADDGKAGSPSNDAIGGPFIPADPSDGFSARLTAVDASLRALDAANQRLATVPLASPAPGLSISSRFGERIDPFLNRLAMHAGIDFRAPPGTSVRATAAGTVIDAGRNGGYGNMVEVDHGGGFTTRYAHLSEILVQTGDRVEAGTVIARSGNTGRSTGPHLHYEVRKAGDAINPIRFLRAGRELARLM